MFSRKREAENLSREKQAMTHLLLSEICNISPQLFPQKMWVLFALHLCISIVALLTSRSSQNVMKGFIK